MKTIFERLKLADETKEGFNLGVTVMIVLLIISVVSASFYLTVQSL